MFVLSFNGTPKFQLKTYFNVVSIITDLGEIKTPIENTENNLDSYEKLSVYNMKFIIHTSQNNTCFSGTFVF
jgi:hypothetical protein